MNAAEVTRLAAVRRELQESAGAAWPQDCDNEVWLLYDVCEALGLNGATEEVMGPEALRYVCSLLEIDGAAPVEVA